jgi:hypothetical protein
VDRIHRVVRSPAAGSPSKPEGRQQQPEQPQQRQPAQEAQEGQALEVLEYRLATQEGATLQLEVQLRDESGNPVADNGRFAVSSTMPGLPASVTSSNGILPLPAIKVGCGPEWVGVEHHLLLAPEAEGPCSKALPVKVVVITQPGNYIKQLRCRSAQVQQLHPAPAAGAAVPLAAVAAQQGLTLQLVNGSALPALDELVFDVDTADGKRLQEQTEAQLSWRRLAAAEQQGSQARCWQACPELQVAAQKVQHTDNGDQLRWPQRSIQAPATAGTYCLQLDCPGELSVATGGIGFNFRQPLSI